MVVPVTTRPSPVAGVTPNGVLAAVGGTPLIALERIASPGSVKVFAKLESLNPGGSVKDRPALSMVIDKIQSGDLRPGRSVVVESSSGNLGVALALICRYFDLRFICVVDPKATQHNVALMKAYGAEVELVQDRDPQTGEYLPVRIRRARELSEALPDAYWPNQYENILNAAAHMTTMQEIVTELGHADYLFCATSSCGTLRGCSTFIRRHGCDTKLVAVDAVGSAIFGQKPKSRLIPGHGAGIRPPLFAEDLAHQVVHVTDLDCVVGCRRLAREEALLAGGSSGGVVSAFSKIHDELPEGSTCAFILADRGERYLDTIYSDRWVEEHFGDVSHLWAGAASDGLAC